MKKGLIWGAVVGVLSFLASLLFHTRAIVMNVGGTIGPIGILVGIIILLRGASFEDGMAVRDDTKSQRQVKAGSWLIAFALPPLLIAFLCWGIWPMPTH